MKITIRVSKSGNSVKTDLGEVIKSLEELSDDYPNYIDFDNVEIVIECQEIR